jgi:glutaredoxin
MATIQLTLLTKPGCHLCDEARTTLNTVLNSDAVIAAGVKTSVVELNILEDQNLLSTFAEEIPVLLVNNRKHSYWHIDQHRLTAALLEG